MSQMQSLNQQRTKLVQLTQESDRTLVNSTRLYGTMVVSIDGFKREKGNYGGNYCRMTILIMIIPM